MKAPLEEAAGETVPRETLGLLEQYVDLLVAAAREQNLIGHSTIDDIWNRHILDSAQLVPLGVKGSWADIGSGAGLPGVVTAILTGLPTTLAEPRRLRVNFLEGIRDELFLSNLHVEALKATALRGRFDTITARAVASASELLTMTIHLSHAGTVWLLPKGRNAQKELEQVRETWQGDFRLVPSRTDCDASILVASSVRRKGKR